MVTYYLIKTIENSAEYEYYPEDDKTKQPGIIVVDKTNKKIFLKSVAERDYETFAEEFNARWWVYYEHAERHIIKDYNNGLIKETGLAMWY